MAGQPRLGASATLESRDGNTPAVKTAISVPDDTFDAATRRSKQLGMSRSEFVAVAARRYLDELDRDWLTETLNAAVKLVDDDTAEAVVRAGRRRLSASDDW